MSASAVVLVVGLGEKRPNESLQRQLAELLHRLEKFATVIWEGASDGLSHHALAVTTPSSEERSRVRIRDSIGSALGG